MKEIKLTQDQLALVDDDDFDYINQWGWYAKFQKGTHSFYAARNEKLGDKQVTVRMHRVIMQTEPGFVVDHINHNTLDNRKANLRNVTEKQNLMNKVMYKNNTTGVRDVLRHGSGYRARIGVDGKRINGKTRKTVEEAKEDRLYLESKFFGEYNYRENK
jgi:hypothetical protein